jgi:hypothetical protein
MKSTLLCLAVLLTGCAPSPDSYPIPPQHQGDGPKQEIFSFGEYVKSSQPDAEAYFLRDIMAVEAGAWRWTHAAPELRFLVKSTENRRFRLEIGVNDVTFRDTGPMRLVISINGREFDQVVYDSPGDKSYDKPVPPHMLIRNAENRVLIRVLNPWPARDQGVSLGFLLHEAGFQ